MGVPDDAISVLGAVFFPAFQIPEVVQMEEEQTFDIKEIKREKIVIYQVPTRCLVLFHPLLLI